MLGGVIPLDRVILQADYGHRIALDVVCGREQGGESITSQLSVNMRGDVARFVQEPPSVA